MLAMNLVGCHKPAGISEHAAAIQSHIDSMLPGTPAARQLSDFLRAVNSGELAQMLDFGASHVSSSQSQTSPAELSRQATTLYREARELDVGLVEKSTTNEIVGQVRSTVTDQWYRIEVVVAASPPYAITSFTRITIQAGPEFVPHRPRSEREVVDEVEPYLDRLAKADMFSGVALIAKDGTPIFEKAYGLASRNPEIPNKINTQFDLASVTKIFTGVAIGQLAEQGKLSFSDTISQHVADYPNQSVAKKVTIHQLLTHSSGMGNFFGPRFDALKDELRSPEDYFPLFADDPLAFEPGTGVQYSNAGFVVLGAIVERVSGQRFLDYLRDHIFKPAKMMNTDAYGKDTSSQDRAIGYTYVNPISQADLSRRESNVALLPYIGGPAGGGYSTAEDLLRFANALHNHVLLSKENTELVTTGKVATRRGNGNKHAYGFEDELVNQHRIVGHGGGYRGVNTQFDIYPDDGYIVIILSNYDPLAATVVADKLRDMLAN
jgi:CubicO group peptidase (beta-lactamase class C family)